MVFVFGGAYSGKADYVKKNFGADEITEHDAGADALKSARAIRDFHLYIRNVMLAGGDPCEAAERLIADNPNVILISNEIGCGIIPLDAFERKYRESSGRVSCMMAERAERVVRVVCGIGMMIK